MSKERRKLEAVSKGAINLLEAAAEEVVQPEAELEVSEAAAKEAELEVSEAAAEGAVNLLEDDSTVDVFTDWSVAKALGVKRRWLVRHRLTAARGRDWAVVNGEVGMTKAWCVKHLGEAAVQSLEAAGQRELVSFVVNSYVPNPQMVIGRRIDNGALEVVHVANARDYHKGMVFEARKRTGGGYVVAYRIPRSDY